MSMPVSPGAPPAPELVNSVVRHVRLMNVGNVCWKFGPCAMEVRANCVDITIRPNDALLTFWSLFRMDGPHETDIDPRLNGRLVIPGPVALEDSMHTDGVCWIVQSPTVDVTIRPHQNETIWEDHVRLDLSPRSRPDDRRLQDLLDQKRRALIGLNVQTRLYNNSTGDTKQLHHTTIECIRGQLLTLSKHIETVEAARDRTAKAT